MLTLDRVSKTYKVGTFGGTNLLAVRDVSFSVAPGEVVSLIGESGSGKSTIGKMVLRLIGINGGTIRADDIDVSTLKGGAVKDYYRLVQGVFQDPFSSCNPIYKVEHIFSTVRGAYFHDLSAAAWRARVDAALGAVAMDAGQTLHKYPHQLSGGQLQRLLVARALLLEPRYLVADEIISMLDASTRIDVLNLLAELKRRGLGILFVTHDLSLGNYISERTVILRRGRVVEMGATERVFGNPTHPYTRDLIASVPHLHKRWGDADAVPTTTVRACAYHAAHPEAGAAGGPLLAEVEPDHQVACFRIDEGVPC
jgi:oligopeptide/dipeptide ABC transporter ATP-binding protein